MYLNDWVTIKEFPFLDGFIPRGTDGSVGLYDFRKENDLPVPKTDDLDIVYNGIVDDTCIRVFITPFKKSFDENWTRVVIILDHIE